MMTTIIKLLISCLLISISLLNPKHKANDNSVTITTLNVSESINEKAFLILENKCNVCPIKRNHKWVFTTENMNSWSQDLYQQVFIKKLMLKGKKSNETIRTFNNY